MDNWRKRHVGTMSLVGEVERKYGTVSIRLDNGNEVSVSKFLETSEPTRDCTATAVREKDPARRQRGQPNDITSGISYLWILNDNIHSTITDVDYSAITMAWENLTDKFKDKKWLITQTTLDNIAHDFSYKSGKWVFYPKAGEQVDTAWKLVVKGITEGELQKVAIAAYVHPCETDIPVPNRKNIIKEYVISIRNEDYTDEHQMNCIADFLRKGGIKNILKYKLDLYTHLGIYPKNPYNLRPTIRIDVCK